MAYVDSTRTANRAPVGEPAEWLANRELTANTRAFAANALGTVCRREALPWGSKIAVNMNYPAALAVLRQQASVLVGLL